MTDYDLTPFIVKSAEEHAALIICPGGGYWRYNPDHQEAIARWLNSIGISAFLLNYALKPERHPAALNDLQRAIRQVRWSAAEHVIAPDKIGVIGFSAGGHLATTAATRFDYGNPNADDPIERLSSRPDAVVLCYPVISFGEFTHEGTVTNLLGDQPDEQLREALSNHKHVTSQTPPTFIWATADDSVVPVENSLLFASALSSKKVPFELHIFPHGPHGVGTVSDRPELLQWLTLAEVWLRNHGF